MSSTELKQATEPIVRFLKANEIQYHIGGSVSSSAHGIPRTTIDVDLIVDLKLYHVDTMVTELKGAYYIDSKMIENAIEAQASFNLIHLETFIKLDIFIMKQAAYDREVMSRAIDGILTVDDVEPIQVKFSSAEDIILNKLHWFRLGGEQSERQWRDILGVLNVQKESLDLKYMKKWAQEIGVLDLLEQIIADSNDSA